MPAKTHGGARLRAGRKKREDVRKRIFLLVDQSVWELWKTEKQASKLSGPKLLEKLLNHEQSKS